MHITHLGFLLPGNYAADQPYQGLQDTLDLFALGESLGYQNAWVRQRHLENGVSSASTFLAAAGQRTRSIDLGAAVIQMGYENPLRLAEDLSMADVLSGGRLQVGLSAGSPPYGPLLGDRFFDQAPDGVDYSHQRIIRLRDNLSGLPFGEQDTRIESPAGAQRPQIHPAATGITQRLWYGGGSLHSARWAGQNGLHLLIGNLCSGEKTDNFFEAQANQLHLFRSSQAPHSSQRVALGRVIVPWDSADADSRAHYQAYAQSRLERTMQPQGERRTLFAKDLVGSAQDILQSLRQDPIVQEVQELRLELPYNFSKAQYSQILHDVATRIAPELGWKPTSTIPQSMSWALSA